MLGRFLAAGTYGDRGELMANIAAYSGLRWGELIALTVQQIDQAARVITVDRKMIEVVGRLHLEAPTGRKSRRTIYPRTTRSDTRWPSALALGLRRPAPNRRPGLTPSA
jgi:integrase